MDMVKFICIKYNDLCSNHSVCAHNIMVSEGNIVAFQPNIIMTAQDITII